MKTTLNVNFTKNNTNKKDEVILEFQVRGELSDEQIVKLARLKSAGSIVVDIRSSQADLDDYEEPREGIRGTINLDGSINLLQKDGGQVTIEEVAEQPAADESEKSEEEQSVEETESEEHDEETDESDFVEEEYEQPEDEDSDDLED